jgi:PAS domain S-box-containing protein
MAEDNPPARTLAGKFASAAGEDRFRAIFEKAGVGLVLIDGHCKIIDTNQAFGDIVGRGCADLLGTSCMDITHPDDVPVNERVIARLADPDEQTASFEKRYLRPDGAQIWVLINLTKILFDEGERVLAVVEDISDRKAAEEQLRQSDERLRLATESADIGTWDFNPKTGELRWDQRCKELFGLCADADVTYDVFLAGLHPEDRTRTDEAVQRALAPDGPGEYDVQYRTIGLEDGVERWIAAKGRAFFEQDGAGPQAVRFIGTVLDISDAKRATDALREESHNLEILNRVGSALAGELDLERVVQMVTDAGVELTGAQFGAFFYNVINADGEAYMLYTLSGANRSQFEQFGMPRNTKVFAPTFAGEGIVRSDDITRDPRYGQNPPHKGMPKGHLPVVSYLAVPVTSRTGEVVGGLFFGHPEPCRFKERHERLMEGIAAQAAIAIDSARLFRAAQHEIEQRVKAEQALTALNETLESRVTEEIARRSQAEEVLRQAQKMETVGQLSGGIAHDFNNLLQVIHGNLSLLQRMLPPSESKWQQCVANALNGAERSAALTQRLLAFSRRQPLDPKPVDVNRLIGDMIELFHRTLGETILVETRFAADLPSAQVDGNQLENAMLNLAINARDAMPRGGRLEISTGLATVDDKDAEIPFDAAPGRYVRITVRDTGQGMVPDVLSRAIEPFFSTKEVGQGTGLGLSMVYGFVKQSGGHLALNSNVGEGAIVELFLPCSSGQPEPRSAPQLQSELVVGRGERILLCEDDDDVRQFSGDTLRELGYSVIEAADAGSALTALRDNGRVDVLFTDIILPGDQTGADLAREARELQPDIKVLFTTGYARSALEKGRQADSAVELLVKPFRVEDLAARLRAILD